MTDIVNAWHFVGDTLRDGRPIPPDGEWLEHDGPVKMCESGLHASDRIIDALKYAPGNTICRVECRKIVDEDYDKFVCRERRIAWRIDGETVLRQFARQAALSVIHLWDAPQVVIDYLKTGDDSLREAAWAGAEDAVAGAAARDAAWSAAREASWAAAWTAVWSAAWTAGAAGRAAKTTQLGQMLENMVNPPAPGGE